MSLTQIFNAAAGTSGATIPPLDFDRVVEFFEACRDGNAEKVKETLDVYPDAARWTMDEAAIDDSFSASGKENNVFPLMYAGSAEVVRLLLNSGAEINSRDDRLYTPLMICAELESPSDGDLAAMLELLRMGADQTLRNKSLQTALDIAKENSPAAVKVFDIHFDEVKQEKITQDVRSLTEGTENAIRVTTLKNVLRKPQKIV